jgi:hypothetical protein
MVCDSNPSDLRLAINSFARVSTLCSRRRPVVFGSATNSEFSFVNHGRVTNYGIEFGSPTGGVWSFAQDGDGIVWAATTSGLWRFDHSRWRQIGAEWDAPQGNVQHLGFDSEATLWALSGRTFGPMDLVFLMPGTRQFKVAAQNLFVYGFTLNADGAVVTEPEPNSLMADSPDHSGAHPSVYPVLRKDSFQIVDRNNGVGSCPKGTRLCGFPQKSGCPMP